MAKRNETVIPDRVNLVAEDTVLEGVLYVGGDVRINGRIVGTVKVQERVVMGPEGVVEGDLMATEADLAGVVQGDMEVAGCLVLRASAHVAGTVRARRLVMEDGAVFNGTCQMGPSIWASQGEASASQEAVVEAGTDTPPPVAEPVEPEEILATEEPVSQEALPDAVVYFDPNELAAWPELLSESIDDEAPFDRSAKISEVAEAQTPDESPEIAPPEPAVAPPADTQAAILQPDASEAPTVVPKPKHPARHIQHLLQGKRTPASPSVASRISALGAALPGMIKKIADRLATPGMAGGVLAVAFGAVLVLYLIFGNFSSPFSHPDTAAEPVAQPAEQATAPDTPVAETNTPSDPDTVPAMTDVGSEVATPTGSDAETEAARQAAEQQRAAMEQIRRRVVARLDEQEIQTLAQQAETARRTGTRAFAAADFEQATRSFQSANRLFLRIKTALDAKDQALADAAESAASDPAESTAEEVAEQTDATAQPAEPEPAPELPPAQSAVQRLAGYLKSNIESENAGGMQALFHRGWEPFFEQAEGIRATVRPGTAEVNGTQATVHVQVDLQYRDAEQASQQDTRSYAWTLQYLDGDWVLMQVAAQ